MEASRPSNELSVGNVLDETFSTYSGNFVPLIGAALVVFVIVGVIAGILDNSDSLILHLLATIVRLAGTALFTGFVVKLVADVRDGRRDESVGDLFSAAAPSIVTLILFGILFGFAVGIGLILLIVPGLILLTIWSLGAPAIVAEGKGVFDAFGRSHELVRGHGWTVFGTLVVVLLIVIVIQIIFAAIANPIGNGAIVVASVLSSVLTAPIFALAVSVMFFDLGGGGASSPATTVEAPPAA